MAHSVSFKVDENTCRRWLSTSSPHLLPPPALVRPPLANVSTCFGANFFRTQSDNGKKRNENEQNTIMGHSESFRSVCDCLFLGLTKRAFARNSDWRDGWSLAHPYRSLSLSGHLFSRILLGNSTKCSSPLVKAHTHSGPEPGRKLCKSTQIPIWKLNAFFVVVGLVRSATLRFAFVETMKHEHFER